MRAWWVNIGQATCRYFTCLYKDKETRLINKLFINPLKKSSLHRHPTMRMLEKAILREIYGQIAATACLMLFGLGLLWLQLEGSVFLSIIGLGTAIISAYLLYRSIPALDLATHPLYRILLDEPRQVVWVYAELTQRMPFGLTLFKSGLVYLFLKDGTHHTVAIPERKLRLVCKFLGRLLPEATVGYSPERARLFAQNPELLRRSTR